MTSKRSWRRFDYLLLGALLLLSVYGVTMIYSATINTLGLENPVQRQMIFVTVGIAVLFVTASVDYHLLEIAQHPFPVLTPLVLAATSVAMIITWQTGQAPTVEDAPLISPVLANPGPVLVGLVLIAAVYIADRVWIEDLDLLLTRGLLAFMVLAACGAAVYLFLRPGDSAAIAGESSQFSALIPYLLVTGLAVAYLLDCLTLRIMDALRNLVYVVMLSLLGITFLIGQAAGGSQRWLGAGTIQPSEIAKIVIIVVLAKFFADREERMEQAGTVLVSLGIVGAPMFLIYLQPDLGTALAVLAIWAGMVWMARIRFRHLFILVSVGLVTLPLVWFALEDYMRHRLLLFVNPSSDPDSYFNVHQSLVSIGSGGWVGKGLTHGTQSQLHFLRVRHTDFIFAVTAEELGFLGAVAMLALIFFVLWRVLRIAQQSRDSFGRLIASGVAALIFFQSVVNVGMNLALMPVTGIPLPFVSYGGSSLLTTMVAIGLVESVALRQKKLEFD